MLDAILCPRRGAAAYEPMPHQRTASWALLALVALGLSAYARHSIWVTSEAYSSPSIVLISGWGPNRYVLDDFREAYYWWVRPWGEVLMVQWKYSWSSWCLGYGVVCGQGRTSTAMPDRAAVRAAKLLYGAALTGVTGGAEGARQEAPRSTCMGL